MLLLLVVLLVVVLLLWNLLRHPVDVIDVIGRHRLHGLHVLQRRDDGCDNIVRVARFSCVARWDGDRDGCGGRRLDLNMRWSLIFNLGLRLIIRLGRVGVPLLLRLTVFLGLELWLRSRLRMILQLGV
jgi:hypothetical protein